MAVSQPPSPLPAEGLSGFTRLEHGTPGPLCKAT